MDILSCPFCGTPPKEEWEECGDGFGEDPVLFVYCSDSKCAGHNIGCSVEEWNKRPIKSVPFVCSKFHREVMYFGEGCPMCEAQEQFYFDERIIYAREALIAAKNVFEIRNTIDGVRLMQIALDKITI